MTNNYLYDSLYNQYNMNWITTYGLGVYNHRKLLQKTYKKMLMNQLEVSEEAKMWNDIE